MRVDNLRCFVSRKPPRKSGVLYPHCRLSANAERGSGKDNSHQGSFDNKSFEGPLGVSQSTALERETLGGASPEQAIRVSNAPSALARSGPPDMRCCAYGLVCGVQEYAESRARDLGFLEQVQYLDEGAA